MNPISTQRYTGRPAAPPLALPSGPPSLVECDSLTVRGDARFGAGVVVRGTVTLAQQGGEPLVVADGTVLSG